MECLMLKDMLAKEKEFHTEHAQELVDLKPNASNLCVLNISYSSLQLFFMIPVVNSQHVNQFYVLPP